MKCRGRWADWWCDVSGWHNFPLICLLHMIEPWIEIINTRVSEIPFNLSSRKKSNKPAGLWVELWRYRSGYRPSVEGALLWASFGWRLDLTRPTRLTRLTRNYRALGDRLSNYALEHDRFLSIGVLRQSFWSSLVPHPNLLIAGSALKYLYRPFCLNAGTQHIHTLFSMHFGTHSN